jgi:hypothetical protein
MSFLRLLASWLWHASAGGLLYRRLKLHQLCTISMAWACVVSSDSVRVCLLGASVCLCCHHLPFECLLAVGVCCHVARLITPVMAVPVFGCGCPFGNQRCS